MQPDSEELSALIKASLKAGTAAPASRVQGLLDGPLADRVKTPDHRMMLTADLIKRDLEIAWTVDGLADTKLERGKSTTDSAIANMLPLLEDYLVGLTGFQPTSELLLELISHEYCLRFRWGAHPEWEEYAQRFPGQSQFLQRQLTTLDEQLVVESSIRSLLADPDPLDLDSDREPRNPVTRPSIERHEVAEPLVDVLKRIRPFSELSNAARSAVASAARIRDFKASEVLLRQGEAPDNLLIILAGAVEVTVVDGDVTHVIGRLGKHTVVGEIGLLTHELRSANVIALSSGQVAILTRSQYEQLAGRYPRLSVSLSELVSERVGTLTVDALFGKTIGNYHFHRRLGRGGMGIVYAATHTQTGKDVAVKMLRHDLVIDRHARSRFEQEAAIVQSLDHPNIVRVFDDFEAFGTCFIAMELCGGQTLSEVIQACGSLPPDILKRILGQLSGALLHAHQSGIAHRDLKPANVMVGRDGLLKLTDFGLARQMVDQGPVLTTVGQILGTPRYMAPEQFAGERGDEKSDYYSLSCLVYELATGHPVFRATRFNDLVAERHGWKLPPFGDFNPPLDESIYDLLQAGLHERPALRTVNLQAMAQWAGPVDWSRILPGVDFHASPAGTGGTSTVVYVP